MADKIFRRIIRRRLRLGVSNCFKSYAPAVDEWTLITNYVKARRIAAERAVSNCISRTPPFIIVFRSKSSTTGKDKTMETLSENVETALRDSFLNLVRDRRKTNGTLVISREDKAVEVSAWDIPLPEDKPEDGQG